MQLYGLEMSRRKWVTALMTASPSSASMQGLVVTLPDLLTIAASLTYLSSVL
uniref:Uncharacterized protein n=1 Tax=Rhizophora mucronata TaxID=61149 RepID=A0A2P2P4Z6_RHIMU